MRKLLIAARSDDLIAVLKRLFRKDFELSACTDGSTALTLIKHIQPDVLILDLLLPQIDGLELLRMLQPNIPPATLVLTDYTHPHVFQQAIDLGAGDIMAKPFRTEAVRSHIMQLLQFLDSDRTPNDPQSVAAAHLTALGLCSGHDGYQQLRLGIPLFRQDPALRLGKELYPAVITLWGSGTPKQIEHSIRLAITTAWNERDKAVWSRYFPGYERCPSNKDFIARLAQFTELPKQ